jgi:hypothetical protein
MQVAAKEAVDKAVRDGTVIKSVKSPPTY